MLHGAAHGRPVIRTPGEPNTNKAWFKEQLDHSYGSRMARQEVEWPPEWRQVGAAAGMWRSSPAGRPRGLCRRATGGPGLRWPGRESVQRASDLGQACASPARLVFLPWYHQGETCIFGFSLVFLPKLHFRMQVTLYERGSLDSIEEMHFPAPPSPEWWAQHARQFYPPQRRNSSTAFRQASCGPLASRVPPRLPPPSRLALSALCTLLGDPLLGDPLPPVFPEIGVQRRRAGGQQPPATGSTSRACPPVPAGACPLPALNPAFWFGFSLRLPCALSLVPYKQHAQIIN